MRYLSFQAFAALAAFVVGVCSFVYGLMVFKLWKKDELPSLTSFAENPLPRKWGSVLLVVGGIATIAAIVGVYRRIGAESAAWTEWDLVLGLACGVLTAVHGMFIVFISSVLSRLAARGDPMAGAAAVAIDSIPAPLDPHGFSRYILSGLWLLITGPLMIESGYFPVLLGYLALVSGVGLLVVFLGNVIQKPWIMLYFGVPGTVFVGPLFWLWVLVLGMVDK